MLRQGAGVASQEPRLGCEASNQRYGGPPLAPRHLLVDAAVVVETAIGLGEVARPGDPGLDLAALEEGREEAWPADQGAAGAEADLDPGTRGGEERAARSAGPPVAGVAAWAVEVEPRARRLLAAQDGLGEVECRLPLRIGTEAGRPGRQVAMGEEGAPVGVEGPAPRRRTTAQIGTSTDGAASARRFSWPSIRALPGAAG